MKIKLLNVAICSAIALSACSAVSEYTKDDSADKKDESGFVKREFDPQINNKWIGNGISYGAYRDGESPDDNLTSEAHIKEDMDILTHRWNLIRLYGADKQAENVLETIAKHKLPVRVLQGIWLDPHKSKEINDRQVEYAIELANKYPEIVVAVNVGNEIFVDWSYHRIDDMDDVIRKIRKVRGSIKQPVTVSDDYNFWNKPHAQRLVKELDFICLHAYAFWNNKTLDISMDWTVETYNQIQSLHPDYKIAYCETGWPTSRIYNDGSYEGGLIGKAGEEQQEVFFDQYDAWAEKNKIISFYFSSFDEKWKGGMDGDNPMAKAEKHWGLYFSDRTPKKALQ